MSGADDLIIFEGGGDEEHASKRVSDPDWHCLPHNATQSQWTSRLFPFKRAHDVHHQPLTTVYYLFNTLDVEITQSPRMEKMWSRVEALYVHGLMIHHSTGSGLSHPAPHSSSGPSSAMVSRTGLGDNLRRVYVLVGSWSGKTGVRHVDFIKKARARSRRSAKDAIPLMENSGPTPTFLPPLTHQSLSSTEEGDLAFFPSLTTFNSSSDNVSISSTEVNLANQVPTITQYPTTNIRLRSSLDSLCSTTSTSSSSLSYNAYTSTSSQDFHISIPQIAWSDNLNHGKGGYYISRTMEDCQKLVLQGQQGQRHSQDSQSGNSKLCWNLQDHRRRNLLERTKNSTFLTTRLRLRPRNKVRLHGTDTAAVDKSVTLQKDEPSPSNTNLSQFSFECYDDFSRTIFSPTSTIFVPPSTVHTHTRSRLHSESSLASSAFIVVGETDDQDYSNLGTQSTWARVRRKFVWLIVGRSPLFSSPSQRQQDVAKDPNKGQNESNGVTFW